MKCPWCKETLRGSVFKFTALHVDPFGREETPVISTGEPILSRIVCESCGEVAVEQAIHMFTDVPPRMVPGGDITYTCLSCASDILDGELLVQVSQGLLSTTKEGVLDPHSVEIQGGMCLRCSHMLGTEIEDDDMRDLRALMCCHICSEHHCWRNEDCLCSCHGNNHQEESDDEPDTDASYFDVLPF